MVLAADPNKAAKYYEDGLARFYRKDYAGAVVQLKNALQQDNRLLAAHLLLGKALLKESQFSAAEVAFNEALRLGVNRSEIVVPLAQTLMILGRSQAVIDRIMPDGVPTAVRVDVLSIRGSAFADLGKPLDAARSFEQARVLDPKSVVPLLAEIPVLLAAGQRHQAAQLADKAVALAPNNAEAWNMHASVAHAGGNLALALERYGKALTLEPKHVDVRIARASLLLDLGRDAEASRDLAELEILAPDEPRAAYLRALVAGRAGRGDEVAKNLKNVADLIQALPPEWLVAKEQLLMLGAMSQHGLGQYEKARGYLDLLIKRNPKHAGARKLLASILLDSGDPILAVSAIEPLLRDAPNDAQALFLLGRANLAQRRYVQANGYFERAARLGADTAELRAAWGYSQLGAGRRDLAVANLERSFARKPGDPQVGLALATEYMQQGQPRKAVTAAQTVVERNPGDFASLNLLGAVVAAAGDRVGARKAYDKALAREAKFTPALLNLAKLDAAEGKLADARRRLEGVLAANDKDAAALYELGAVERQAGRTAQAQAAFEKARDLKPADPRPGLALVDMFLAQRAVDVALNQAKDLAARHRTDPDVLVALAGAQLAAGDRAGAAQTFKDLTLQAEFDAATQVRIGRMQLAGGLVDGAAYNAQKALTASPGDPDALVLQADTDIARKDLAKAEVVARELQAKQPTRPDGYRLAGDIAAARGQAAQAQQAYRIVFDKFPSSLAARSLAQSYVVGGEPAKAAAVLEKWLASHGGDLDSMLVQAETYTRLNRLPAARNQYERALTLAPGNVGALNNLALIQARQKDPAALATAEKALALMPQNPVVLDTAGWIAAQQGKHDTALRYLRDARLRQPDSAEIRYHLAFVLAKLSRQAEAKAELDDALRETAFEGVEEAHALRRQLGP